MAREKGPFLDVGDKFPAMEFSTIDGKRLCLPEETKENGPYCCSTGEIGEGLPPAVAGLSGTDRVAEET